MIDRRRIGARVQRGSVVVSTVKLSSVHEGGQYETLVLDAQEVVTITRYVDVESAYEGHNAHVWLYGSRWYGFKTRIAHVLEYVARWLRQ